ncbi:UDP-N-acetylmuramoyl-tripeptide--D-alanyl-D-alanine ligase [Homoserinimonas sp. OAct 916]|uniref:UDP-N-acetylmuramoyl-tripeptide--D-alanyl-D- alanine ligase n=1 Tax=Homoserinimonas sp. OAct 916 TaxID=2211450 RepID=UPI000DBE26C7|nr:UDP-N-acetylmuramoyl-tripeptide--D-alanyl-D-alanine ligase [Homoserinimonas sp. OAct 916]
MIELTLAQITDAIGGELVLPADGRGPETVISGATETNSGLIEPGSIFVAKRGDVTDGHLYAPDACDRGAALLIVERRLALDVPQIVVDDSVRALGALATHVIALAKQHGRLRIIGITGSNGKTTTKNLLGAICARAGKTIAAKDSFNNEVGGPHTMLRVDYDTDFLVAEMGASAIGEIASLVQMAPPDVGVVLKVGLAHAGEFGGIEATTTAKTEMVASLATNDVAVLNRDDGRVVGMAAHTRARVIWFGLGDEADVRATDVHASADGTTFTLTLPGEAAQPVRFRVLGEHHVMNALAAAASAHALGIGPADIVAGLEEVTRAERWRMEVMGGARGVTVINDAYNASPDSMAAALKTLAQITDEGERSVAVLGQMSELGELAGEEHDRIGLLVVRLNIKQLVVVGHDARRMFITANLEGSWDGEALFAADQAEALTILEEILRPGDRVLVKSSNSAGLRFLGDTLGEMYS